MHKNNKAQFIFGFLFYFIGDLATTYLALSNGMPESGLVRIITRYDFSIMVLIKVIFFVALYFFIEYLERDNYLCGAVLGLVAGMGMTIHWMNALTIWEYLKWLAQWNNLLLLLHQYRQESSIHWFKKRYNSTRWSIFSCFIHETVKGNLILSSQSPS